MADLSDNHPSQSESYTQCTQKMSRSATRLKGLTLNRSADQRTPIEFDQVTGNPLGPSKKIFKSYVGLLGRSKASILKNDWDDVELSVKEQIWECIMVYQYNSVYFVTTRLL